MKNALFLFLLLLVGCAATPVNTEESLLTVVELEAPAGAPKQQLAKRIYYFQHKLISKWVFDSAGAFFVDLQDGKTTRFYSMAEQIITPEYAQRMEIRPVDGQDAVLLVFPEPTSPGNSFFALIEKTNTDFNYYTYEKTLNFSEYNIAGVLGGWDKQGQHSNYGPRSYQTSAEFIQDVLSD